MIENAPSPDEPLVDLLRRRAASQADGVAVCDSSKSFTWSALARAVTRGALRLKESGLRSGDRVLIAIDRCADFALAYFSVHAAGGVCVIPPSDTPGLAARAAAETEAVLTLSVDGTGSGPVMSVESLCAPGPERGILPGIDPGSIANILYTTGSTGTPKGVVLTHSSIAHAASNICQSLQQTPEDVELGTLPLSHSFGLGRLHCMVRAGSSLRIEGRLSGAGDALQLARDHRVTGLALTPAGLAILRRTRADEQLRAIASTLRYVELTGASIDPRVRDWVVDLLPSTRLIHQYGLTEASRAASLDLRAAGTLPGQLGRPAPDVVLELRDPAGRLAPCGADGAIWIRGPILAREYWRQPELTSITFVDGALRTTDLGRVDDQGRLQLVGRSSDIINVGGIKVAPQEIESILDGHADIVESACCAIPDPAGITGERVAAFVVTSRPVSQDVLLEWLRQHGLDRSRMPVLVESLPALPRTPSGKLLRRELQSRSARTRS